MRQITLFLASPGDVPKERKYVHDVVAELNRTTAKALGVSFNVIGWERDAHPGYGADAQDVINKQIGEMSTYALFVGLMWNRVGTRTLKADSGTVEEFDRAISARAIHGRPDIWFYFRDAAARLNSPGDLAQRKQVLTFKKRLKHAFVGTYITPVAFKSLFREHLTKWAHELVADAPSPVPAPSKKHSSRSRPIEWVPKVAIPLHPAPHFAGRAEELALLAKWVKARADNQRVVALTAVGGTGKTALAAKVFELVSGTKDFGVFVWSFYDNPQTEAFLSAACAYFARDSLKRKDNLFERLQDGLSGNLTHTLFLDGLEVAQASGTTGRPRGELDDPLLRRLLRWLAGGSGTRARALITTRFPILDLSDWSGAGFTNISLDDLDEHAARAIFRRWGVKGNDAILDDLSLRVHRHALTIDVLGSYLGTYHDGDPTAAPSFDPHFLIDTDIKAAKLHRVLESYAAHLLVTERDLIARIALFPTGVNLTLLDYVVKAGESIAGSLVTCTPPELMKLLERLRSIGLIFRYGQEGAYTFSAHPFLKGFFEKLLSAKHSRQLHESVRSRLAQGLNESPVSFPDTSLLLDRYERLIEITRLAGYQQRAFDVFDRAIGGYTNLGCALGEYARGIRIVLGFSRDGTPRTLGTDLEPEDRLRLLNWWALFAVNLGDLPKARDVVMFGAKGEEFKKRPDLVLRMQNSLAILEANAGRWSVARNIARSVTKRADCDDRIAGDAHAILGSCLCALGDLNGAAKHFRWSKDLPFDSEFFGMDSILPTECRLRRAPSWADPKQEIANLEGIANLNSQHADGGDWARTRAIWRTIQGRLAAMQKAMLVAHSHLSAAQYFANKSGDTEVTLRCYELKAMIARVEGEHAESVRAAERGIELADSSRFGRWSIECRLELAASYLGSGNAAKARKRAVEADGLSRAEDARYVWGMVQGSYMAALAYRRQRKTAKAREWMDRATKIERTHGLRGSKYLISVPADLLDGSDRR